MLLTDGLSNTLALMDESTITTHKHVGLCNTPQGSQQHPDSGETSWARLPLVSFPDVRSDVGGVNRRGSIALAACVLIGQSACS